VARHDNPLAQAFPIPALRKEREERGTHCAADASKIKSLGHPPLTGLGARFGMTSLKEKIRGTKKKGHDCRRGLFRS